MCDRTEVTIIKGSIYIIRNYINDKVYIGQTIQAVNFRFNSHIKDSKHKKSKFYNAIKKYGKENFYYSVLETNLKENELDEKEQYYIRLFNSVKNGYNTGIGGEHNNRIDIPDADILRAKELYLNGYSLKEAAKEINTTRDVLTLRLKAMGVEIMVWNEVQKIKIDDKDLIRMYCDEMMTADEIAELYNTSGVTIAKHLKKCGIKLRPAKKKEYLTSRVDKDALYDAFVVQGLSYKNTAEALNICIGSVQYWTKFYGFKKSTDAPLVSNG